MVLDCTTFFGDVYKNSGTITSLGNDTLYAGVNAAGNAYDTYYLAGGGGTNTFVSNLGKHVFDGTNGLKGANAVTTSIGNIADVNDTAQYHQDVLGGAGLIRDFVDNVAVNSSLIVAAIQAGQLFNYNFSLLPSSGPGSDPFANTGGILVDSINAAVPFDGHDILVGDTITGSSGGIFSSTIFSSIPNIAFNETSDLSGIDHTYTLYNGAFNVSSGNLFLIGSFGDNIIVSGIGINRSTFTGDVSNNLDVSGTLVTGNDILIGESASLVGATVGPLLYGDFSANNGFILTAGNDILTLGSSTSSGMAGDGNLNGSTATIVTAGDDILVGGSTLLNASYKMDGDVGDNRGTITNAGDDILMGGTNTGSGTYELRGDIGQNTFSATLTFGGKDTLVGGTNSGSGTYLLVGDIRDNTSSSNLLFKAGDDTLTAGTNSGSGTYLLVGDMKTNSGTLTTAGNDVLKGGAGNDVLIGDIEINNASGILTTAGNDVLDGGAGNDTLYGDVKTNNGTVTNWGKDQLSGESGNDQLFGQGGNDTLDGGADDDILDGGADVDTAVYSADALGSDTRSFINGSMNAAAVVAEYQLGNLMNYSFSLGTVGAFTGIQVNGINDGAVDGNDLIVANIFTVNASSVEKIDLGGVIYNLINGINSPVWFAGTSGDDLIVGGSHVSTGSNQIWGDVENNTVTLASGNDIIFGKNSIGSYLLYGDVGSNSGTLTAGHDVVIGADQNSTHSYRVLGDTSINTGTMTGGDDVIIGRDNNSTGDYSLIGDAFTNSGTVTGGSDVLIAGNNNNTGGYFLYGELNRNDSVITTAGNDLLIGGNGNDNLYGDVLENNLSITTAGNDRLDGGEGDDTLVGDVQTNSGTITTAGNDTFVFTLDGNNGNDMILDMNFAGVSGVIMDTLEFSGVGITSVADVDTASTFSDSGGFLLMTFNAGGSVLFQNIGYAGQTSVLNITSNVVVV